MSWIYPRFRPIAGHPMDYREMNENLSVVSEEIDGSLGEHNWEDGAVVARTDMAPGAVVDVNFTATEVDPSLETGTGRPGNGVTYAGEFLLRNLPQWQSITGMSITKVTGNSLLWIIGSLQQQRLGDISQGSVGAQYAVRLNGVALQDTVTGGLDRVNDRKGEAVSHQAHPFVTDAVIPVPPGEHTIEIVARAPRNEDYLRPNETAVERHTEVYNRELIVLTIDPPEADLSGAGPAYSPLAEGANVVAADFNTAFTNLETEVNDLDYTSVKKESLHATHLPSTIIDAQYVTIGSSSNTFTNAYVDFDSELGWLTVTDGGASPLATAGFTAVDLSLPDNRGLLVMANVHLLDLRDTGGGPLVISFHYYAVFAIQVRDAVALTWHTIAKTERYSNSEEDNLGPPTNQMILRKNIPIRTFIDQAAANAAGSGNTVDLVRVVIAVEDRDAGGASGPLTAEIQEGDLTVIAFQAGA